MHLDVLDLRKFYYRTRLGRIAQRAVRERVAQIWPSLPPGSTVVGFGFAAPLLRPYLDTARRVVCLMPAEQGVMAWPEPVGPEPLIRLDGNGAYTVESAIAACDNLAEFAIASAEQLIPSGNPADYARLQAATAIPQIADESLITLADAQALIATQACQGFNLRLSKCGGLAQTLAIARLAEQANVFVQVGCQVGETAILSAAGRHLAAGLPQVKFVEGSYGKLLLSQDISRIPVQFGYRGQAPVLTRPGLGIEVQDEAIAAHAHQTLRLETPSSVHH